MEKLILIDGSGLIYRGFYAIPPFFKGPDGKPTNAVYGFATILLGLLGKYKPDYIAVALDKKGPTFRHEAFKEYKATRVKAPQDLYDQIPMVNSLIESFGIPMFGTAGFEADDIIATIVHRLREKDGIEILIATGDLDMFQLVSAHTKILYPLKGFKEAVTMGEKEMVEKYGFMPTQIPDYKGLAGDNSDNLPGVKGIGPKGACDLLKRFGSLEKIYEHVEEIGGSIGAKLVASKEQAFLCKSLATLRDDVPVDFDLSACTVHNIHKSTVEAFFGKLGFRSLAKRLAETVPEKIPQQQESLF